MLITMIVSRTPAQLVRGTLSAWTVAAGSMQLAQVQWDPSGPLGAVDAALGAMTRLELAVAELDRPWWLDGVRR